MHTIKIVPTSTGTANVLMSDGFLYKVNADLTVNAARARAEKLRTEFRRQGARARIVDYTSNDGNL